MITIRFLPLAVAALVACAAPARAQDDLAGPHECALWNKFYPCTLTALPEGGYAVKQTGCESFEGTLTPKGAGFHLDGVYKFPADEGSDAHLVGDVDRQPNGVV